MPTEPNSQTVCIACEAATELNTCTVCGVSVCNNHADWDDHDDAYCLKCSAEEVRAAAVVSLTTLADLAAQHQAGTLTMDALATVLNGVNVSDVRSIVEQFS